MESALQKQSRYFLIVDDDADDHYFLRNAIGKVIPHALVESVYDGSEALQYLNRCLILPDLIFLDLNMLKISGQHTISLIRERNELKDVPVVVLTTSKNEKEKSMLLSLGASDFYSKPHETKELVTIVKEVVERWL